MLAGAMPSPPGRHPSILREHAVFVRDGKIVHEGGPRERGDWVYAWTRADAESPVLYVGATALALAERVQLHLESPEPTIGRIRAEHPEALEGEVVVRGFLLVPNSDRQAIRRALAARLLLGMRAEGDPLAADIAETIAVGMGR